MELNQAFKRDKQRIHDNMAHCLFCIYNQQDITHYFAEMMEITDIMKMHYENYNEATKKFGESLSLKN